MVKVILLLLHIIQQPELVKVMVMVKVILLQLCIIQSPELVKVMVMVKVILLQLYIIQQTELVQVMVRVKHIIQQPELVQVMVMVKVILLLKYIIDHPHRSGPLHFSIAVCTFPWSWFMVLLCPPPTQLTPPHSGVDSPPSIRSSESLSEIQKGLLQNWLGSKHK